MGRREFFSRIQSEWIKERERKRHGKQCLVNCEWYLHWIIYICLDFNIIAQALFITQLWLLYYVQLYLQTHIFNICFRIHTVFHSSVVCSIFNGSMFYIKYKLQNDLFLFFFYSSLYLNHNIRQHTTLSWNIRLDDFRSPPAKWPICVVCVTHSIIICLMHLLLPICIYLLPWFYHNTRHKWNTNHVCCVICIYFDKILRRLSWRVCADQVVFYVIKVGGFYHLTGGRNLSNTVNHLCNWSGGALT